MAIWNLRIRGHSACATGVATVVLCATLLLGGLAQPTAAGTLTVTGVGEASATPDSAVLRVSIVAAAARAEPAMEDLSEKLSKTLDALRSLGIPDADLQTTTLRLDPIFAPQNNRLPNEAPRIDGYRAVTGLSVNVGRISLLGSVVDVVLDAGVNGFDGVQFALSDPEPQRALARTRAVEHAMRKARDYAEAAGVALGPITQIREGSDAGRPMPMAEMRMAASMDMAPGELTLRQSVTIEYEITPLAE